ncbi:MAG: uracil-DNA glycosylase family protein [Candidatus Hydrogenedentota bacterium]
MSLTDAAATLARLADTRVFSDPVTHVYNPAQYAAESLRAYIARYARTSCRTLLLGMNPGPFGMVQTGVPFGDVQFVREWLAIDAPVGKPRHEHPKRPVRGFECARREVSGQRLWGWARAMFDTPDRFFDRFFVWNYCPLCFLECSGRNRTPDKLPKAEREPLFDLCDDALRSVVNTLTPTAIVGIGKFAEQRIAATFPGAPYTTGSIPHPSPANPQANRGWAGAVNARLTELGLLP